MTQSSKRGREEEPEADPCEEDVAESVLTPNQTLAPPCQTNIGRSPTLHSDPTYRGYNDPPRSLPQFRRRYSANPRYRQPSRTPQCPPSPNSVQRHGRLSGHSPSSQSQTI